ncbi:MAG TPA: hypothetical protein VGK31_01645 [Thermoanaerobaculia bacterium]
MMNGPVEPVKGIHWGRALVAGLVATVVMTIVGVFLGMNFMKSLGSMLMPQASISIQYAVGGAIHLTIGLVYGVIYAWLVGRVSEWPRAVKGIVYGLAITAIALAAMPLLSSMTGGGGKGAGNPCHMKAMNPCQMKMPAKTAKNPCHGAGNPCNPCGGGSAGPYSGAMSIVMHLAYALPLAFAYGRGR